MISSFHARRYFFAQHVLWFVCIMPQQSTRDNYRQQSTRTHSSTDLVITEYQSLALKWHLTRPVISGDIKGLFSHLLVFLPHLFLLWKSFSQLILAQTQPKLVEIHNCSSPSYKDSRVTGYWACCPPGIPPRSPCGAVRRDWKQKHGRVIAAVFERHQRPTFVHYSNLCSCD